VQAKALKRQILKKINYKLDRLQCIWGLTAIYRLDESVLFPCEWYDEPSHVVLSLHLWRLAIPLQTFAGWSSSY